MPITTTTPIVTGLPDWFSRVEYCRKCSHILELSPEYGRGGWFVRCLNCRALNILSVHVDLAITDWVNDYL